MHPQVRALLQPTLAGWCEQLSGLLAPPLTPETMRAWRFQLEALRILTLLAAHFGKDVAPYMPALTPHIWQLFSGAHTSSFLSHKTYLVAVTRLLLAGTQMFEPCLRLLFVLVLVCDLSVPCS